MVRNATGRLSDAVEDTASASSQPLNRPMCRRTNGHSARKLPSGALRRASGVVGAVVASVSGMVRASVDPDRFESEWVGAGSARFKRARTRS
ncbi:hypothetical protein GCM10025793_22140 [Lysobacter lycopersici]